MRYPKKWPHDISISTHWFAPWKGSEEKKTSRSRWKMKRRENSDSEMKFSMKQIDSESRKKLFVFFNWKSFYCASFCASWRAFLFHMWWNSWAGNWKCVNKRHSSTQNFTTMINRFRRWQKSFVFLLSFESPQLWKFQFLRFWLKTDKISVFFCWNSNQIFMALRMARIGQEEIWNFVLFSLLGQSKYCRFANKIIESRKRATYVDTLWLWYDGFWSWCLKNCCNSRKCHFNLPKIVICIEKK